MDNDQTRRQLAKLREATARLRNCLERSRTNLARTHQTIREANDLLMQFRPQHYVKPKPEKKME